MRILVFILVIVVLAGLLFWNSIFSDQPDGVPSKETGEAVKTIPVENEATPPKNNSQTEYKELMGQGKWAEALAVLDSLGPDLTEMQALAARYFCLFRLGRQGEAQPVLNLLMKRAPSSPITVQAVFTSLEDKSLSALEKRKRLSLIADGFGSLKGNASQRLVEIMKEVNTHLPESIQGSFNSEKYTIVSNDNLWNICKKFNGKNGTNIEPGLLCMLNGIEGDRIYPGQVLAIPRDKVSLRIWRNNWLLAVFLGNELVSAYRVGLGQEGSTPVGSFVIRTRLKQPDWYSEKLGKLVPYGSPENILGSRWLGFENRENARGLGIHGTTQPESIGKNLSSGCIRLINEDIEKLFDIIGRGTPVQVM